MKNNVPLEDKLLKPFFPYFWYNRMLDTENPKSGKFFFGVNKENTS